VSAGNVESSAWSSAAARLADYLELTKPKIAVLVLVTVTVGYTLGSTEAWRLAGLLHALLGIALVAAGSSALNQYIEREIDVHMQRTAGRPLPAGRLSPIEVLLFGVVTGVLGALYLAVFVNMLTALLAAATFILYTMIYTPLKRRTSLCTAVGAIPGALPPVLGWTSAGGGLDSGAFALFAILFLWQFPHFLAIAWLYRDQYTRAGLRMLPAAFPSVGVTGLMSVAYALVLIPISLLPRYFSLAGDAYLGVALLLGAGYLLCALRFSIFESVRTARGLLWSSLIYLPLLLIALTWDHLQLLR
jgi:protoheme IX farnesyltransferase